ncbi:MAG: hypothetical protein HY329_06675 [Chloroflexi bacterium]|nr:hypothetical protein [Chloroflexota bacterium]
MLDQANRLREATELELRVLEIEQRLATQGREAAVSLKTRLARVEQVVGTLVRRCERWAD